jgi:cytochrome P450
MCGGGVDLGGVDLGGVDLSECRSLAMSLWLTGWGLEQNALMRTMSVSSPGRTAEPPSGARGSRAFRPPAPRPGYGDLSRIEVALTLRDNPLRLWRDRHFALPVVSGEGLLGFGMVISEPRLIRHVLVDNVANYRKDDLQLRVLSPGLGDGLLTAEGEDWRRVRRIVAPLFTPRRVAIWAAGMQRAVERNVRSMAALRRGRVRDISHEMTRLTYDVLAETLFSNALPGGADAFSQALTRYMNTQGRIDPLDLINAPRWVPRLGRLLAEPAIRYFSDEVRRIVADRQALVARGAAPPDDLLTALLTARDAETGEALSDVEVGANIVTFIAAGHETTANLLTWAFYLLASAPQVREAVEREADAVAADPVAAALAPAGMPMTRAVIDETLRLYPPVASMSRVAIAEDRALGVEIPKGALTVIAPYVLHRHRALWAEPDLFDPSRFLPGEREKIDRHAFLPFGAGPRVCVGAQFALVEATLAIGAVCRALRLDYAGERPPEPIQRITLRPRDGMPMAFRPR